MILFALFSFLSIIELSPCDRRSDSFSLYDSPSLHWLVGVSVLGDSVELEDGSVWQICRYDGPQVLNWRSQDPITITQNHRWFSTYAYRIVNHTTGASLEANLFFSPLVNGPYTLYVTAINPICGDLLLTNGSGKTTVWKISSEDLSLFQDWELYDAVIVGQNSDSDVRSEALLINVNMDCSIRATMGS